MRDRFAGAFAGLLLFTLPALAAPHLGMKIAVRDYGDAWNSGSRSALMGSVTSDFGHQWSRMPPELFARLPRGGGGRVLSTSKGNGSGTVTVATSQGIMTFLVVGRGFRWTVADIYKAGDDGQTVSLKNYLDVSLTANEFINNLKYVGGTSFYPQSTEDFRSAFAAIDAQDLVRVRHFMPDTPKGPKPFVTIGGASASVRVDMPERGEGAYAVLYLRMENGWRVDDYVIDGPHAKVASFKKALPTMACLTAFREFVNDPVANDPTGFTAPGSLRQALVDARFDKPFPMTASGAPTLFKIVGDCRSAEIVYPDRTVRFDVVAEGGRGRITSLKAKSGDNWSDVTQMLVARQRLKNLTISVAGIGLRPPGRLAPSSASSGSKVPDAGSATKEKSSGESVAFATTRSATPSPAAPIAAPVAAGPKAANPPVAERVQVANSVEIPASEPVVRPATYRVYYQSAPEPVRRGGRGLFGRRRFR